MDEKHDYETDHPGPFTFKEYLKALLQHDFWGDEIVLTMISLMWNVTITVVVGEKREQLLIKHKSSLKNADIVVVYCGDIHYSPAIKLAEVDKAVFDIIPTGGLTVKSCTLAPYHPGRLTKEYRCNICVKNYSHLRVYKGI